MALKTAACSFDSTPYCCELNLGSYSIQVNSFSTGDAR
eukprot:UN18622